VATAAAAATATATATAAVERSRSRCVMRQRVRVDSEEESTKSLHLGCICFHNSDWTGDGRYHVFKFYAIWRYVIKNISRYRNDIVIL